MKGPETVTGLQGNVHVMSQYQLLQPLHVQPLGSVRSPLAEIPHIKLSNLLAHFFLLPLINELACDDKFLQRIQALDYWSSSEQDQIRWVWSELSPKKMWIWRYFLLWTNTWKSYMVQFISLITWDDDDMCLSKYVVKRVGFKASTGIHTATKILHSRLPFV